jgi:ribosomal protein L7/L12
MFQKKYFAKLIVMEADVLDFIFSLMRVTLDVSIEAASKGFNEMYKEDRDQLVEAHRRLCKYASITLADGVEPVEIRFNFGIQHNIVVVGRDLSEYDSTGQLTRAALPFFDEEVLGMLKRQKIAVIKRYRERFECSLTEAKNVVEDKMKELGIQYG